MPTSKKDFNELLAEKRRQAHVTMRALDSVLWEDPRDLAAAKVVAQKLWNAGLLTGIELTETMVLHLDKRSQKQYYKSMAHAA